ncbi:MAG: transglutaminaseTgpA domain-containing protein [Gemmatales bacterium]|nr:transglutaminaseTgpA domain-containing protein [Gemmatales bacterium]
MAKLEEPNFLVTPPQNEATRRNWLFYASHWLTFVLALCCLAVVDDTAPVWLYPLVGTALTVAMAFPGRWQLGALAANLLGLFLILGWVTWMYLEYSTAALGDSLAGDDRLRVAFIRGGTLLALLLLAKWLRPRNVGDYWMMHALALVQVVLACATLVARPEDPSYRWFPLLLLGYLTSGVWAVIVLQLARESAHGDPGMAAAAGVRRWWRLAVSSAVSWCMVGVVLALIFFLTIPRLGSSSGPAWWQVTTLGQSISGVSGGLDLTSSNSLRLSDELVIRLDAWDAAGNKIWLGDDLRLRVLTCSTYEMGKWRPSGHEDLTFIPYRFPLQVSANHYRLQFQVDLTKLPTVMGLDLAGLEEYRLTNAYPLPLAEPHPGLARPRVANWFHAEAELLGVGLCYREPAAWVALATSARLLRYTQLYDRTLNVPEISLLPGRKPDFTGLLPLVPPWSSTAPRRDWGYEPLDRLPQPLRESGRLEELTRQILMRHRLPPRPIPGESAEQVLSKVKVLENYLANNPGEFVYSLSRSRLRHDLDPTEEFLLVAVTPDGRKAGWCQHYASALALLLRAHQIPARIVLGFRGGDWNPTWRTHEIRAYHAHAWVEAFIGPRGLDGRISQGRWLSFDPTPAAALSAIPTRSSSWWRMLADDLRFFWEIILLDGTTGQGFRSFATVNHLLEKWHLAGLGSREFVTTLARAGGALILANVALVLWWRLRRARQSIRKNGHRFVPLADWEQTLLERLQRIFPARKPNQSLLEYAYLAQSWLLEKGVSSVELCSLPVRMTEAYYRYRFAGLPPTHADLEQMQRQFHELSLVLDTLAK